MTRDVTDAPADKADTSRKSPPKAISELEVVTYLKRHPDFLERHPDLLQVLKSPVRHRGEKVADIQRFMVDTLQDKLKAATLENSSLARRNRKTADFYKRLLQAIIAMLEAQSFEHFVHLVSCDLVLMLNIDVVALAAEVPDLSVTGLKSAGVTLLPVGYIEDVMGDTHAPLRCDIDMKTADPALYGAAAGLVRSQLILRLEFMPEEQQHGLLCFGSRDEKEFELSHAEEEGFLFLAKAVQELFRAWLV